MRSTAYPVKGAFMGQSDPLRRALNCDTSVFIQACAGAGKTFALTKRYAAILDRFAGEADAGAPRDQIDHKKILVITFTKKAAGEMTERIQKDVNLLLSGNEIEELKGEDFCPVLRKSGSEKVRNFTRDLKNTFSQNSISTIDSFCSGLIKEFAHKLDIDPQFALPEDAETQRFLTENLETWLKKKVDETPHVFDKLLKELNFDQIRRALRTLYGSREVMNEYTLKIENGTEEAIWRDWLERYTPDADIESLASTFDDLWGNARSICKDHEDNLYKLLESVYHKYYPLNRNDRLEFSSGFLSIIRDSGFLTKDNLYRKDVPGNKQNWEDKKASADAWFNLLQTMIDIKDLVQSPGPQDKKIIPLIKELITLYRDFNEYYSEKKAARNLLDFSDVIIKTHELLSKHTDVRKQIAKRYRHIMLDEFQDTNPMRWDIIRMIFEAGDNIRLFIVGDRKQSIYRFNHADVTVMNKAEALIRRLNGEILDFNENYRSSESFVNEGINFLIGKILPAKQDISEAYEADFQPTRHKIEKENITPALEMHWCNTPKEKDDANYSALHAALHVKRLLEEYGDSPICREGKPLIGVLFRKFSNIADYLQVFRRFDIPIEIIGGKGFYQTASVMDIFHFLSVLDNPYDDHALIGLLRSPFIALSDPEIHLISKGENKHIALFDRMRTYPELNKTRESILFWIDAAGRIPLDELIGEIMDSEYRELGYVSELLPQQQLANLDKAINIIRGMQRKGSTLREIREYFYYQIKNETAEAQAVYPGTAKVHLLTIHKAKGLEYPIVLIPEMNSKGNARADNIRFGHSGSHSEISLSLSEQEKPGLLLKLKEIGDREEEAEDKRIFYVALTRALYKACFLGEGYQCESNTWWHKYILKLQELIDSNDKPLKPDAWSGEPIMQKRYDELQVAPLSETRKVTTWTDPKPGTTPGLYLYRSPHDLMGDPVEYGVKEDVPGPGLALGSLYHLCVERNWLDFIVHQREIKVLIDTQFPDADKKDLLSGIEALLERTRNNDIYRILNEPSVEKYHELPLRGWLKKGSDLVQVNGKLDLLYCEAGRWVVLDFKTDNTKMRLSSYHKQLLTYKWMLKQAYGIDAEAKIFFVSLGEMTDIEWSDTYYDHLPVGAGFRPGLPDRRMDAGPLLARIREGKHLLFCVSAYHEEQIYLALVKSGRMRPDITVTTLNKWLGSHPVKGTSRERLRLMIPKIKEDIKPGIVDYLVKAFRDHELKKGEIKADFSDVYEKIKQDPEYCPADLPYRTADVSGLRIGFIDMVPPDPLDEELIERLHSRNESFHYSLVADTDTGQYDCIEAFSPKEEVLAVAKHIRDHTAAEDDILIAVSSMEKYAPHLKRLFPHMGLHVRFTDMKAAEEYPVTTLLLNVIKISTLASPSWQDMAPILLHPLMKPDHNLLCYDKKRRSTPWEEEEMPPKAREFIENFYCRSPDELLPRTGKFIKDHIPGSVCREDKVCENFMRILGEVIRDFRDLYSLYRISMLYQELKTRIREAFLPRKDQFNGIPVAGFLDSLGSVPDKLYIMGMVEGDIPRPENDNPCLNRKEKRSLELNRHFMDYWKKLGDRVVFSYSLHAEDGSDQNRSSFLQDLSLRKINYHNILGPRAFLLTHECSEIEGTNMPLVRRHNEIITGNDDVFSGRVEEINKEFHLPVTAVDTLLACPMRFYFDIILDLELTDADESKYWKMKKGSVIHKAFEYFTKADGFSNPPEAAVELLKKEIYKVFEEENINMENPFQADHFRDYMRDLEPGSETNVLVVLLNKLKEMFPEYERIIGEMGFRDFRLQFEDIGVYLNGRIDKLMFDDKGKKMIAADYKTGKVEMKRLRNMFLSQLYLYLKKTNEDYPDYDKTAIYELINNGQKNPIIMFRIEGGDFIQENSQKGNAFNIDEFENHLKTLFIQIGEGNYYITQKAFLEACKYCPHDGLCRKSTRIRKAF